MITDKLNTFGTLGIALDGGGVGSNMIGTEAIDINTARDIGAGEPIYLVISTTAALGGTGTISFNLLTGATDPLVTGDDVVVSSPVISAAAVTEAQTLFVVTLPQEGTAYERYLQMSEVVATSAVTGNINAFLTLDPSAWRAYPQGQSYP